MMGGAFTINRSSRAISRDIRFRIREPGAIGFDIWTNTSRATTGNWAFLAFTVSSNRWARVWTVVSRMVHA